MKHFFKHKAQILGQQLRVILALNDFSFGPKDIQGRQSKSFVTMACSKQGGSRITCS